MKENGHYRIAGLGLLLIGYSFGMDAAAQAYQVDPERTTVTFSVQHMGVLTVTGRFTDVAGIITCRGEGVTTLEAEIVVKAASVDTDNRMRDRSLRSGAFLNVAGYPDITFTSKRVEPAGDDYRAVGDLTLRGVTREITLPVSMTLPDEKAHPRRLHVETAFFVHRSDFDLSFASAMDALVGEEVRVEAIVEAVLSPSRRRP